MTESQRIPGAVVVCTDLSAAGCCALRWAAAEAVRREAPLHVLAAGRPTPPSDRSVFADAVAAVRRSVAQVPVLGGRLHGPIPDTVRGLSADAAAVVVPATLPELARLVAESYCPVIAVPARGPVGGAELGPVVLGAASWTGLVFFVLAFREAAERRADLVVVRAGPSRGSTSDRWPPSTCTDGIGPRTACGASSSCSSHPGPSSIRRSASRPWPYRTSPPSSSSRSPTAPDCWCSAGPPGAHYSA